jgi:hypothetical protein
VASPIPDEAPVTIAVLLLMMSLPLCGDRLFRLYGGHLPSIAAF